MALRAVLVSPEFLFRVEQDPAGRRAAIPRIASAIWNSRRACRSSSGAAFRTTNCSTPPIQRQAADARGARKTGAAHAGRSRGRSALVNNFAEQWLYLRNLASTTPDMRLFPGFRRQSAAGVPPGDRAVLREHHARGPQRARPAAARTTPSSTNGWPSTTEFRMSTAAASGASTSTTDSDARRAAAPGQHSDGDFVCHPHLAVIRGKWILTIFWACRRRRRRRTCRR